MRRKVRIGELLVQNKVITEEQLNTALAEQKKTGLRLGRALIELKYIDEDRLLSLLSLQLQIPFVELTHYKFDQDAVQLLPETHSRRFRAIVLEKGKDYVLVGMADPADIFALDELQRILRKTVRQAVVRESELLRTLDVVYRRTEEIKSLAKELNVELSESATDMSDLDGVDEDTAAPVMKLLQSIFEDAVRCNASDIHIEPDEHVLRIRQRVDGVLAEHIVNEKRIVPALVLRLKLMCGLNISEKRLPQDGRFQIKVGDKRVDVRLSTMPVQYGESVVMRLLDQSGDQLDLDCIGMPEAVLTRLRYHIHRPHGIILVTGPTGSGKTTTLYSALKELNQPEIKIITCEDPVEYRLSRVQQVQVNTKIDLHFATVLRTALRQDPDVVMIGEMRDQETATIGLRAALTGHLVLSTLHTNDSIGSAVRLIDMGAEGFLVAAAVRCIIAQRLVRKICDVCVQPYELQEHEKVWLTRTVGPAALSIEFKKGAGCNQCNGVGYRGRMGVYELLEMDPHMAEALRRDDTAGYVKAAQNSAGYRPLALCALDYASNGDTTLEEVFRLSAETSGEENETAVVDTTEEELPELEAELLET